MSYDIPQRFSALTVHLCLSSCPTTLSPNVVSQLPTVNVPTSTLKPGNGWIVYYVEMLLLYLQLQE